ncbi:MAG: DEAD/DEAH box helicase family protein [Candidatus Heimdallarchaeota archaeon]|nr:DEAD/DEAH box helicase family protein [Candidatus Heimdallarchaeota archaeon]
MDLKLILLRIPSDQMKKFFGSDYFEYLNYFVVDLLNDEDLILKFYETEEAVNIISDPVKLEIIISVLNEKERQFLYSLFGLSLSTASATFVDELDHSKSSIDKLLSFFGEIHVPIKDAKIHDFIKIQPIQDELLNYGLFDHQQRAAELSIKFLSDGYRQRTLLHMPTGSGKTRTAMKIAIDFLNLQPDSIVIWITNSKVLCRQATTEFETAWRRIGTYPSYSYRFYTSTRTIEVKRGFFVSTFQKLYMSMRSDREMIGLIRSKCSLIVVDEAHISVAKSYYEVLDFIMSYSFPTIPLLGLSATPGRSTFSSVNNEKLVEFFSNNKVILSIKDYQNPVSFLLEKGYLSNVTFYRDNLEDYSDDDLDREMLNIVGTAPLPDSEVSQSKLIRIGRLIHWINHFSAEAKRIIVFTTSVSEAYLLALILRLQSIWSYAVSNITDVSKRKRILDSYHDDDPSLKILTNFEVLATGFDAPQTDGLIIARRTKSIRLYNQMVGRARRGPLAGGKEETFVVTMLPKEFREFDELLSGYLNWEEIWLE